jgi:hypothetical protein
VDDKSGCQDVFLLSLSISLFTFISWREGLAFEAQAGLYLPTAEITDMHHHVWLCVFTAFSISLTRGEIETQNTDTTVYFLLMPVI